jgi:hypothetical protein
MEQRKETTPITGPIEGAENPITSDLTDSNNLIAAVQMSIQLHGDMDGGSDHVKNLAVGYGLTTIFDPGDDSPDGD